MTTPRAPRPAPIGIVTALPEELEPIRKRAKLRRDTRIGGRRFYSGTLAGVEVVMTVSGDGRRLARTGARSLLELFRPSLLIGAGVAGGLSPGLERGAIVVADELTDGRTVLRPDEAWRARAVACGAEPVLLATVDRVVVDPAAKSALHAALGSSRAAVDMESWDWADEAISAGVPFLVVRSVYERAEDRLPDFLLACEGAHGGVSRVKVARYAAGHPGVAPELLRMRQRLVAASARLAPFLERLLEAASAARDLVLSARG